MTKIEWCDESWNPITGCTPISDGCKNCYASRIAKRFWGKRKFSDIQFHENRLEYPILKWKKSNKIFVCSMGDLLHKNVEYKWIEKILRIISACDNHTFIILTKRPQGIASNILFTPKNMWLGVTVENQKEADKRIPILLESNAKVKFVSCEPMLERIDLTKYLPKLDWVICGAETGAGARYMNPLWAMDLLTQCCREINVPFFMKKMSKRKAIPEELMVREFPKEKKQ